MELKISFNSINELKQQLHELVNSFDNQISGKPIVKYNEPQRTPIRQRKKWTQFDINTLVDFYNKNYKTKQIAKTLQRSAISCSTQLHLLFRKGLIKHKTNRPSKPTYSSN